MNYNKQHKKFKHLIKVGPVPVPELINLLKNMLTVQEIGLDTFSDYYRERLKHNAFYCINNQKLQITPDEMVFRFFEIIKDKRAKQYFVNEPNQLFTQDMCYIIFEEKTGYMDSSSNKLFLDMMLKRGVSQEDYDNEGLQFRALLGYLNIAFEQKKNLLQTTQY